MTYNLHATVHLSDEAKLDNTSDTVASFLLHNYLQMLKKLIRKLQAHLQHMASILTLHRYFERSRLEYNDF